MAKPSAEQVGNRMWFSMLRASFWLSLGLLVGFLGPYAWVVDRRVAEDFAALQWQVPTRVMARPLRLQPGMPLDIAMLRAELQASAYHEDDEGADPGRFVVRGGEVLLTTRAYDDMDGAQPSRHLRLLLANQRLTALQDAGGRPLSEARIDPARIATLYGEQQEERRLLALEEVPELLLVSLQAVEDRDFKSHFGIDFGGIVRAAWTNLRHGEVRQGGSTLTQQLVRNLYLSREQTLWRKFREIVHALVIERRFSKAQILQAYINQVFLGQDGEQAVHGFGAAAEFWFGRDVEHLKPHEIALLVGMIRGPSWYDPRRQPERALQRRNSVLDTLAETGVLPPEQAAAAKKLPLGVRSDAGVRRNRAPAFLALVKTQLANDYRSEDLRGAGLTLLTTLAPSAQSAVETAAKAQLQALSKPDRAALQVAVVMSDPRTGEVLALLGDRNPAAQGFNRALDAQRPVGSLLKPLVYLLALAQPSRWSLASTVEDAPLDVALPNGKRWRPDNSDGRSHGLVTLQDALVHSYNQATVRVGLDVGMDRLSRLIEALSGVAPAPHPSLVLGAVDMSPYQVAQLYQFLASGGQIQPLRAIRAVLDAQAKPLQRYDSTAAPAEKGDALAARLVGLALQEAVRSGTARGLLAEGLGHLAPAGKTGTSNDGRDSWFAGYTGSYLGVVWVGNDDNAATGLYGASGAMRVWAKTFSALPNATLQLGDEGVEWVWLHPEHEARTDPSCPGARRMAFVAGYAPEDFDGCPLARLRHWFGGDDGRD